MAAYDRGSKWLIEHFGGSFLRLAGIEGIGSWRAVQPEIVHLAVRASSASGGVLWSSGSLRRSNVWKAVTRG